MKLRTHISKQTGSWVPAVEIHSRLVTAINHDAMLAHALVMAMNEQPYTTSDVYMSRADKIMASWGYGED